MTLETLAVVAIPFAIVFHAWRTNMTKTEFLSSVSASIGVIAASLASISSNLSSHPSTGNAEFDPDGKLAETASQLSSLAETARQAADALNPATPGGINDATDPASAGATEDRMTGATPSGASGDGATIPPETSDTPSGSESLSGQSLGEAGADTGGASQQGGNESPPTAA